MQNSCKIHVMTLFQGYNGSQLWDTAFAVQAIISTNLVEEFGSTLRKGHKFIKDSQVGFSVHQKSFCF